MKQKKIAIIGTAGVPGNYGGFETLAENLVRYHSETNQSSSLTVFCSTKSYSQKLQTFLSARLEYIPLKANGSQSIPYDIWALYLAVRQRSEVVLLLGVSGALALPFVRLFSRTRVVTNIDGIEWRRKKWRGLAKLYLRLSEKLAITFSNEIIADNIAIADYVRENYGVECTVIPYGGDHALLYNPTDIYDLNLPLRYVLGLCRIEPENNVEIILNAFSKLKEQNLVFVGNWDRSSYGRDLRQRFGDFPNIHLIEAVYEPSRLRAIRDRAWLYVHGHSAGGTNPSLVEMMHFGIPVSAFDCNFNRFTTENKAHYFESAEQLRKTVKCLASDKEPTDGIVMQKIANEKYTWAAVGESYLEILV